MHRVETQETVRDTNAVRSIGPDSWWVQLVEADGRNENDSRRRVGKHYCRAGEARGFLKASFAILRPFGTAPATCWARNETSTHVCWLHCHHERGRQFWAQLLSGTLSSSAAVPAKSLAATLEYNRLPESFDLKVHCRSCSQYTEASVFFLERVLTLRPDISYSFTWYVIDEMNKGVRKPRPHCGARRRVFMTRLALVSLHQPRRG